MDAADDAAEVPPHPAPARQPHREPQGGLAWLRVTPRTMPTGRPREGSLTRSSCYQSLANQISVCLCIGMIENDIFRALADPTRRAIFEKLAAGGMNASALREGMEISQPAMSQHLSVLRSAKLVREERQGRFVNYEVDPEGLALIAQWLAKYRAYWPTRIDSSQGLAEGHGPMNDVERPGRAERRHLSSNLSSMRRRKRSGARSAFRNFGRNGCRRTHWPILKPVSSAPGRGSPLQACATTHRHSSKAP